jgi:hypothetical protein
MMSALAAAGSGSTVPTETAVILGAVIAGVASLLGALVAGFFARRNEKSRQQHENNATRRALLREEAAGFAITAVELAERASAVARGPKTPEAVQALRTANGKLRTQYETLRLISESTAVQEAARLVVRAAWNERQGALGEARKRPRRLGSDAAVIKEMRAWLEPFLEEVRKELGVKGELAPEPED